MTATATFTTGVLVGTPHNRGTIDLLEELEATLGHDLWAEGEGREHVQHWDCQNCGAVLERRFLDGLVTGAALTTSCSSPPARQPCRAGRITLEGPYR